MPQLLSMSKYYCRRGGAEAVFFGLDHLFERAGCGALLSSKNARHIGACGRSPYFADEIDFRRSHSVASKSTVASKFLYSFRAKRRIGKLVEQMHDDIAHAHNICHHLSPSVLVVLRRRGIPVLLTLGDLKLDSPAYKMHTKGGICGPSPDRALSTVVLYRCTRGLAGISALAWFGPALPRAFCLYVDTVSRIPTPGALFRTKFAEWGLDTANFLRIPNLFDVEAVACDDSRGNAFVYFGRVGAGKGLATRLRAVARARSKLRVVGTGPDDKSLRRLAQQTRAEIEFCGKLSAGALRTAIARVHAVAVPLDWYENAPVDLMEASALARPVVGTCIGGIPELIRDDETGVLFESGAEDALAAVLERVRALSDLTLAKKGHADREWMRAEFMPLAYRDHMLAL